MVLCVCSKYIYIIDTCACVWLIWVGIHNGEEQPRRRGFEDGRRYIIIIIYYVDSSSSSYSVCELRV